MPFSSLSDPNDLARAQAAIEAVWNKIKATSPGSVPEERVERERNELAYIAAALVGVISDDDELRSQIFDRWQRNR
ncbi:hypothetical protein [Bosea sp. BK604]|uniref:hypothetical protein n=1 Tax=Bosea sp. BK604 TaxID=2512180 RepID=UPI00105104AC|nr:hypothetical protein [Bosea sp. BK604]TCR65669.1 hypothetical protein EV560_105432 [Bosea sp. BK604]